MLKKTITTFLLVVLGNTLAFGFHQDTPWQKFNSPEGKFNLQVPSKPEVQVRDVDSPQGKLTLYTYSSSNDVAYFMVSYGDYTVEPTDAGQKESVLENVRGGVLKGLKAELVSEKKISLHGYPGQDFTARKKTEQGADIVFNWRTILVGRRLYQLGVVTAQKDSASPDIAKFLTSFDLNR